MPTAAPVTNASGHIDPKVMVNDLVQSTIPPHNVFLLEGAAKVGPMEFFT